MGKTLEDPFEVLGLEPGASSTEIHRAYRRLVYNHHPDRNPEDPSAAERLVAINAAYQKLKENGWKFERTDRKPPVSEREESAAQEEPRPATWSDGSPIHYPTPEEIEVLQRGAEVPKINPAKKAVLFVLGMIAMYYLLEVLRGGESGGDSNFGPGYYLEQNKRYRGL